MTDTDIDKRNETRRASLAKARQVLANERAKERERVFAQSATRVADPPPRPAAEFEGLTATECCDECVRNLNAARGAQKRINEFEVLYKRHPSRVLGNETVMEGDAEWLSRNFDARAANLIEGDPGQPERPELKAEWKKLTAAVGGLCIISGKPYCASPTKGGLHSAEKNDYEALKRFKRAKEMLMDAKLDLQKMSQ
jgi:hypothetical protein